MKKLLGTAAIVLALSGGTAFAQGANTFATARASHAHGTSAYSRDVGPGSSVTGRAFSPLGSAANGEAHSATAPSAGPVNGGN